MFKEFQLYIMNTFALLVSFTSIEDSLKVVLLLITIGYSFDKWLAGRRKWRKQEQEEEKEDGKN